MRMCGTAVEGGEAAGADRSGAGTYSSRPAPAELASRTIRSRRDVPQQRGYPGTPVPGALVPTPLRYRRPLRYLRCVPVPSGAVPPPRPPGARPPGAAAAPVPQPPRAELGCRRRIGAGSARRLLLKPDPAPPSAPLSPRRPHPRPATGARRQSAAPGRGPRRWVDVVGRGIRDTGREGAGEQRRGGGLSGAGGKAAAGRDKGNG